MLISNPQTKGNAVGKKACIVGGDQVVWPAGAATLSVQFRPAKPREELFDRYRLVVGDLAGALAGAYVQSIEHTDVDALTGTGTAPIDIFTRDSTVNHLLFKAPSPAAPPVVTFGIGTPPVADAAFSAALCPSAEVTIQEVNQRKKARRAIRKLRSSAKRRGFFKRVGRGIKNVASGLFRRFFRMRGIDDSVLAGIEDELMGAVEQEVLAACEELMGEVADELERDLGLVGVVDDDEEDDSYTW